MMMSKPQEAQEDVSPPAFTTPVPQLSSVEDLERRLKLIGNANPAPVPAPAPPVEVSKPFAVPPPAAPEASVKSGKTALLARIKAAKEKTQQAQAKPPPAPKQEIDLLSDFDAPARADDPPPFYDTNFLPPPPPMEAPPPAFDATLQFAPPPPLNSSLPPPPPMDSLYDMPPPVFMPPPEASAPSFEDLLGNQHHYGDTHNLLEMPTPLPPPPEIDEDILAALDPAERQAILEEQRKIMEQIERERSNDSASSAAARAMAFDQRSSAAVAKVAGQYDSVPSRARTAASKPKSSPPSYKSTVMPGMVDLGSGEQVPLHGQEKTQKAIQDGTALIVQCLNCQNWMQVTKDATLMFCPTCQVVSPVLAEEAATPKDMEKAAQLAADAQLAEKLQAEEYGQSQAASSGANRNELRVNNQKRIAKLEKGKAVEQSWYDWFMGSSTTTSTTTTQPAKPTPDRGSAEIRRGLVAASTGEESYGRGSYDESDRLMGGGGGARVAESKGMFACVADAVGSAVYAMNQDEEGNVHGVDASGLLAMPNVSRQRD